MNQELHSHAITMRRRLEGVSSLTFIQPLPNPWDYPENDWRILKETGRVYYPSPLYAEIFQTMGKAIFPNLETYTYSGDKIKQTLLFRLLDIPHPRTQVFYFRQREKIPDFFSYPFIAKIPRGSSLGRGIYLIRNHQDLSRYLEANPIAYIQEYIPIQKDLRVILIQGRIILAYWKIAREGEFRTNVAQGGSIGFEDLPEEGLELAREVARRCRFNDVGLDLCHDGHRWLVLEANMNYGLKGMTLAGLNWRQVVGAMIERGEI
jgi:ribosomal protein S6--L-glutamate ligase